MRVFPFWILLVQCLVLFYVSFSLRFRLMVPQYSRGTIIFFSVSPSPGHRSRSPYPLWLCRETVPDPASRVAANGPGFFGRTMIRLLLKPLFPGHPISPQGALNPSWEAVSGLPIFIKIAVIKY